MVKKTKNGPIKREDFRTNQSKTALFSEKKFFHLSSFAALLSGVETPAFFMSSCLPFLFIFLFFFSSSHHHLTIKKSWIARAKRVVFSISWWFLWERCGFARWWGVEEWRRKQMGSEGVQASSLLLRTIRWDQMCEVGGEILSFIFLLSSFFQKTKFGEEK